MLTIAVDAMGGDNAPKAEVKGAIHAATELGLRVILVGQEDVVGQELAKHAGAESLPIEARHAEEVITMEDSAARVVRTKKNSSIHLSTRLVRYREANGFVS